MSGTGHADDPEPEEVEPEEAEDLIFRDLGTSREGLAPREAARRLDQRGANVIERRKGESRWIELARQFTHPLAILLWAAAALALAGGLLPLTIAIVAVIVINAVFAFVQELEAERATEALAEFLPPRAKVRRGGEEIEIDAASLVPGDLLLVEEGDRLSADARLIDGSVEVDMAPMTGESQPVTRSGRRSGAAATTLLEAEDLVFSGCMCTAGSAEGIVFATGMHTQIGRIAALSQRVKAELSPLQVDVNRVARLIAGIAVAAGVVFFAIGAGIAGLPISDAITFAIGLLVANVPEGLLPTITLALAVGVRRMARRKALVKRLTAVETLGSTDVICTDKTGTLTEGRMEVIYAWADGIELTPDEAARTAAEREPFSGMLRTAVRCNNARLMDGEPGTGDSGEVALLAAAAKLGENVVAAQSERRERRLATFPFEPRLKRMTTRDLEATDELWLHSKGAPMELLGRCSSIRGAGGDRPLTDADRDAARTAFEDYARRGLRVLGFAERRSHTDEPEERERVESDLVFLGLMAMEDPPRPEVFGAVASCHEAGIRVIVVTGDTGLTAEAIARQVGIVRGESPRIITGAELEALSEPDLDSLLEEGGELIVARSNPETKLHLVDALRHLGHTVAMTGDGVNDAPALRRADIGVAMGRSGTDVAREAATMVLTDDNFASIVEAVQEGRVVYENLRKFVTYIFAHATPEVVPFLIFALSGGAVPAPITVLQILAIDLGTDTLPALALGREPAEPGVMERPPRPRHEGIVSRRMLTRAWLWIGGLEALLVTGGFFFVLTSAGWAWGDPTGSGTPLHSDYLLATTVTFAGIVACQAGAAFAVRTSRASLWSIGVFSNRPLLRGIAFSITFAAALIYVPPLQDVFDTAALGPRELALLAAFPVIVWGTDEARRWLMRRREAGEPDLPASEAGSD